jgi:small nuclear ribonucleoprotein (snRNP)-like protein
MTLPLDEVGLMIGKDVTIMLRNGKEMTGKLLSFDLNANIGLDVKGDITFIQGQEVTIMSCADSKQ